MAQSKKSLPISLWNDVTVLHVGDMEIWDGADLALLRECLVRAIRRDRRRSVGVDMSHVKYIPSGFFGMLFDWWDLGVRIFLFHPQPNVQQMLWFSRFFQPLGNGCYELCPDQAPALTEPAEAETVDAEAVEEFLYAQ